MAGIYVHIPFCRKRCFYCDFYKSTVITAKPRFLESLFREMELQAGYSAGEPIKTIYFGGGTPSVLTAEEVTDLLHRFREIFPVQPSVEFTMEVNPDDLSPQYLHDLLIAGINRLSIGIQSFSDADLKQMNRRHTAQQAETSVRDAFRAGFSDISIDLIFALPWSDRFQWRENLQKAFEMPVNHLSAYHLTYHEGTTLYRWLKTGKISELPENESIWQFEDLMEMTVAAGFEQYEISNFARNQAYSKHNGSYWSGEKYLGLGPSAHSFNGTSRQWNVADVRKYIESLSLGVVPFESEILTPDDRLNDYLITRLRTRWGISLDDAEREFGKEAVDRILKEAATYVGNGCLTLENNSLSLTRKGILISDRVILSLISA